MLIFMPGFNLLTALRGVRSCAWLLCVAFFALSLYAAAPHRIEGLGKGAVPLDGAWQFHLGDNLSWAAPDLDDTAGQNGWEEITADQPWGAQTHPNYTGFAWYRKRIELTTAPGAPTDISLLIPAIDDAYEIYWNRQRVGGLGTFPPHLTTYDMVPAQTYLLGHVTSGVLAVRVYRFPLASNDDGTAGGFESAPWIGSPSAIAAARDSSDYAWLHGQVSFICVTLLYVLVAFLSFLAWARDRSRPVLFWMAIVAICPFFEFFASHARIMLPNVWLQALNQAVVVIREVAQWFVLVWILELQDNRTLMRILRWGAVISIAAGCLDGLTQLFFPWPLSARGFEICDAVFTVPLLLSEPIPAVLGVLALVRGRKLGFSRWLVAALAIANALYYSIDNISSQGIRFTHWTLASTMVAAHITLFGNVFAVYTLLRLLLFLSIVYAVILYARDELRRRSALESEFQNARELQRVLVPETQPAIPGFALTTAYIPAREVGGDFYQILPLDDGSTFVVLGDVSGKGLRAAMAVSLIVGAIRTLAKATKSPAALLSGLNEQLCGRLQGGFATCIAMRLDADGSCTLASAGHPAPLLNGREVELPGSLPAGIAPGTDYAEETIQLAGESRLALYTDGLPEARCSTGELYGFPRLQELFRENPTAAEAAEAAVVFGQEDDITVLTLTRAAVPEPAAIKTAPELSPSLV